MKDIVVRKREPVGVIRCVVCCRELDTVAEKVKLVEIAKSEFGPDYIANPPRQVIHRYFACPRHDDEQIVEEVGRAERGGVETNLQPVFTTKWRVEVVCQKNPDHCYPTILELPEGNAPPKIGDGLGEGHHCLVVIDTGRVCGASVRVASEPTKQIP